MSFLPLATAPPTYENSGHNNNLSFIVTGQGVVVVNAGAANLLAKALHDEIKAITDEPVILVINENGQGHAMLGNGYWAAQGVPILAHVDAAHEFEEFSYQILERMQRYNRDKSEGSIAQGPTQTFEDHTILNWGRLKLKSSILVPLIARRRCCMAPKSKPRDCWRYGIPRTYAPDFRRNNCL